MTKVSPKPGSPAQRIFLYAALSLIAVAAVYYQGVVVINIVKDLRTSAPSPAQPFAISLGLRIIRPEPDAVAAGLRDGDILTEIGGHPIKNLIDVQDLFFSARPGTSATLAVLRNGQRVTAHITLRASTNSQDGAAGTGIAILLGVVMPVFCLVVGLYVAAVRPRDPVAWLVMALLLAFSQTVGINSANNWPDLLRIPAHVYHYALFYYWPAFLFLFAYYFPEPPRFEARRPWLKWILLAPFLLFGVYYVAILVAMLEDARRFFNLARLLDYSSYPLSGLIFLLIGFSISLFWHKAARSATSDGRRRLRLLVGSLIFGLTPLLAIFLVILGFHVREDKLPTWVFVVCLTPMIFVPASIAYVIVVDRAMDLRVAVRQGLQYAFARGGLVVLRILTLALFAWIGWDLAKRFNGNVPALIALSASLLGVVLLINLFVKRLGAWVDRRFFREAYNAETVLTDLTEEVRTIRETGPLLDTVCNRIGATLHVARVAVVLQKNGRYVASHSIGFNPCPDVEFSAASPLVNVLSTGNDAPRVYFEDSDSWLYRTGLDDVERDKLASLGSELLLPMRSRNSLLGFISAGQKRSEEPYSKSDVRILLTVAAQTGLALENAQLTTAIAAEAAQRQRLASEVEIAREVQERLFPQTLPAVPGIDYAGMCRTALGVGGDYYDFLALAGGRFGFAVADVAGKGISAALMMASLQASLRGEMSHVTNEFASMIGSLNNRVFEASTSNRYATFFFAVYTPETRRLDYVNAGHNPPILLRREGDGWTAQTLEATGTVVGLLANSEYGDAHLTLQPGDYFVAFTDGISEAMNHADEEWGEESLTETLRACAASSLSANESMRRILSAADTFVNGAKQHDDMTLVVIRVL